MVNKIYKPAYVKKILFDTKEIEQGIEKAANWINKKYAKAKTPPVLIAVLKGSIPFYTKLLMNIKLECICDFIVLSSFQGTMQAQTTPRIVTDIINDIYKRDVVVIEDVADTARSLSTLINYLKSKKPKSVKTMVLVDKPAKRLVPFKPDYACFVIQKDPFLIGYGLDIKEQARNLPYIAEFDKKYLNKI